MPIYIYQNNRLIGPIAENAVWEMLKSGQLPPDTLAIREGENVWRTLIDLYALSRQPLVAPNPQLQQVYANPQNQPFHGAARKKKGARFWLLGVAGVLGLIVFGAGSLAAFFLLTSGRTALPASLTKNLKTPENERRDIVFSPDQSDPEVLKSESEALAKMSPPLQAVEVPTIKGKLAIVEKSGKNAAKIIGIDYEFSQISRFELEKYGVSPARLAFRIDEIETLIQINCRKGALIRRYEGGVAGHANDCRVSVIDYKKNVAVARKAFSNDAPPVSISPLDKQAGELVFPMPEEVEEYVSGLQLEKLAGAMPTVPVIEDGTYGKYKPFKDLAGELARISFPVDPRPEPVIKGKMAVAMRKAFGRTELMGFDPFGREFAPYHYSGWGVGKEKLAEKHDEIETLVQINCRKGVYLGTVNKIRIYSNQCTVSVVDYKASSVIAQNTFENKLMDENLATESAQRQYIVMYPYAEIDRFIRNLPKS